MDRIKNYIFPLYYKNRLGYIPNRDMYIQIEEYSIAGYSNRKNLN